MNRSTSLENFFILLCVILQNVRELFRIGSPVLDGLEQCDM